MSLGVIIIGRAAESNGDYHIEALSRCLMVLVKRLRCRGALVFEQVQGLVEMQEECKRRQQDAAKVCAILILSENALDARERLALSDLLRAMPEIEVFPAKLRDTTHEQLRQLRDELNMPDLDDRISFDLHDVETEADSAKFNSKLDTYLYHSRKERPHLNLTSGQDLVEIGPMRQLRYNWWIKSRASLVHVVHGPNESGKRSVADWFIHRYFSDFALHFRCVDRRSGFSNELEKRYHKGNDDDNWRALMNSSTSNSALVVLDTVSAMPFQSHLRALADSYRDTNLVHVIIICSTKESNSDFAFGLHLSLNEVSIEDKKQVLNSKFLNSSLLSIEQSNEIVSKSSTLGELASFCRNCTHGGFDAGKALSSRSRKVFQNGKGLNPTELKVINQMCADRGVTKREQVEFEWIKELYPERIGEETFKTVSKMFKLDK